MNIKSLASAELGAALLAGLMLAAMPALAGPRDDVKAGVTRCDGIADDHAWLDCFYGAAQPMRARLGLSPAPQSQTRLTPEPSPGAVPPATASTAAPTSQSGGFMSSLLGSDVESHQPMTAYGFDRAGLFTVTLADGSVWQQLTNDGIRAGWRGSAAGYQVTVSRGALGSTSLTVRGSTASYHVKQVK